MTHYIGQVSERAAIFNAQGHVLLMQNPDKPFSQPLTWELPGGRLDKTDQAGLGVVREIEEETGLTNFTVHGPCFSHIWRREGDRKFAERYDVLYLITVPGIPAVTVSHEHIAYVWEDPNNLDAYDFASEHFKQGIEKAFALYQKLKNS